MSKEKPAGQLVIQTLAMPMDTNPNGDIFGGWLLSQMDLGASILAKRFAQTRTATVAIDSMVFRSPVHVGDVVSCYAKLERVGNTSMAILVEVWKTDPQMLEETQVTEGLFTFVALSDDGRPCCADPDKRGS